MRQLSTDKRKATWEEVAIQNNLKSELIMPKKNNVVKTIMDIISKLNISPEEKYSQAKYMLECYQTYSLFPCENRLYERASAVFYAYFIEQGE